MGARSFRARRASPGGFVGVLVGCVVLLLAAVTVGVAAGSVPLAPSAVWRTVLDGVLGRTSQNVAAQVVWEIRLPRVVLAAVVGAALSIAGAVVQALVRNNLGDPYLLGVSSGASVGATATLLFGTFASAGIWALSVGSVIGSAVAMALVFVLARSRVGLEPTRLILCGVVCSALFQSATSFLIFRGDPQATQAVLFWLMGSFGNASWPLLPIPLVVLIAATVYLIGLARPLNALALGQSAATALGVDVRSVRRNLFVITSLMVGVAVAVSGVIGFVGLVVPHVARLLVGADHRRLLVVAVLFGATFMVIGDLLARVVVAPQEMPLGVITAVIGAPTVLVLLRRRRRAEVAG